MVLQAEDYGTCPAPDAFDHMLAAVWNLVFHNKVPYPHCDVHRATAQLRAKWATLSPAEKDKIIDRALVAVGVAVGTAGIVRAIKNALNDSEE